MNLPGITQLSEVEEQVLAKMQSAAQMQDIRKSGMVMDLPTLADVCLQKMAERRAAKDHTTAAEAMNDMLSSRGDPEARSIYSIAKGAPGLHVVDEAALRQHLIARASA